MEHKLIPSEMTWEATKIKGFYAKEFIHAKNGGVKLIRVDAHSNYQLHRHPEKMEYIFVLEGNPHFVIDTERYAAQKGDFFTFPTNKNHAIENDTSNVCILLVGAIAE